MRCWVLGIGCVVVWFSLMEEWLARRGYGVIDTYGVYASEEEEGGITHSVNLYGVLLVFSLILLSGIINFLTVVRRSILCLQRLIMFSI